MNTDNEIRVIFNQPIKKMQTAVVEIKGNYVLKEENN